MNVTGFCLNRHSDNGQFVSLATNPDQYELTLQPSTYFSGVGNVSSFGTLSRTRGRGDDDRFSHFGSTKNSARASPSSVVSAGGGSPGS